MKKNYIYLMLVLIMASWGFNVIALKMLVVPFTPITMNTFRVFTAGVIVLLILLALKQLRWPTQKEWGLLTVGSLFNVVLHHSFLAMGLSQTSASNGGLILGTGPLLTTILAILFLGDRATILRSIGIALGFTGAGFIVLSGKNGLGSVSIGDLYVFLSIFVQSLSFILIKIGSKTMDPRMMTCYMLLIGSPFLLVSSLYLEPNGLASLSQGSSSIWLIFFASALFATALGHMLYNYAIGKIGASQASIFINLNPFFALLGAVIFLEESIYPSQIVGFIFILSGVLLGSGAIDEHWRWRHVKHQQRNS